MAKIAYRRVLIDGLEIFYREAGHPDSPTLLLLHGFPTSGHMFRDLMPRLEDRFHLVAPDFPGFGQSAMPSEKAFDYTFSNIAHVIGRFTEAIGLARFALYIFDYGAPVGLRMALKHPERITAIISQNGNAYEEGLSRGWDSLRELWKRPTDALRQSLRSAFTPDAIRDQYTHGVADASLVSPDGSSLDAFYMARPGAEAIQLRFFEDYGSNVALYPEFQQYFRSHLPPLLAVWGKNDPYFLPAGAEAFRRDIPSADIRFFDTGHFALETHGDEIAAAIAEFLDARLAPAAMAG